MEKVYDLLTQVFTTSYTLRSPITKLMIQLFINSVFFLQSIQFYYPSITSTSDWSSYESYWKFLRAFSIDSLSVDLNLYPQFLLFILIALFIVTTLAVLMVIQIRMKKKVFSIERIIFRVALELLCEVLLIPVTLGILIVMKYSYREHASVLEYYEELEVKNVDYGSAGVIGGVFFLLFYMFINEVYEICAFEIRIIEDFTLTNNRISCRVSGIVKLLRILSCCLYINRNSFEIGMYLMLLAIMHFIALWNLIVYIPYYCIFTNCIKAFFHADCLLLVAFFWIGLTLNSTQSVFILSLLIQLPLALIIIDLIKHRYSKVKPINRAVENQFELFELSLRQLLTSNSHLESLLKAMQYNNKHYPDQLNSIAQAYYCSNILKDHSLALIKIITVDHNSLNIFKNYRVYQCKMIMLDLSKDTSDATKLLHYFTEFSSIKKYDKRFCENYSAFLHKVLERNPKLSQLKSFINKLIYGISYIKVNYEKLVDDNPYITEAKEAYGSFLLNILCDIERGHELVSQYSFQRPGFSINNSMALTGTRCFFVVSASEETLGNILYWNKNFLNFLGYSENAMKECNLNQLLPQCYRLTHNSYLKNFLENLTDTIIINCSPLCLLDSSGFLVECTISSHCASNSVSVNFLCFLDPVESNDQEFAFVDESGRIWAHSKNFPSMLCVNSKYINDGYIHEFLPVNIMDMTNGVIIGSFVKDPIIPPKKKFLNVLRKQVAIKSLIVNFLYVSEDKHRNNMWNDHKYSNDATGKRNWVFQTLIESHLEKNKNKKPKKVEIFDEKDTYHEKKIKHNTLIGRSKQSSQSSSISVLSAVEMKSLKISIRVLNTTKCVLLLSVILTQMFIIVSSNIAILAYISNEVSHSKSMSIVSSLSQLGYSFSQVALIFRALDLNLKLNSTILISIERGKSVANDLKSLQDLLLTEVSLWSYCKASNIINQDLISYWEREDFIVSKNGNLFNILEKIITHVLSMQADRILLKLENQESNYADSLFFLIFNCLGSTYIHTMAAIDDAIQCEINRLNKLTETKNYLLLGGSCILSISYTFMILYLLTIDKHLNSLWEYLRKRVAFGYVEVKHSISERLADFHQHLETNENDHEPVNLKCSEPLKFRHSIRYILRFSIPFAFGAVVYLVSIFVFYDNIYNYLIYRPALLSTIMQRRTQLTELCFYTMESAVDNTDLSLQSIFPEFYGLQDWQSKLNTLFAVIEKTKFELRDPNIDKLLRTEAYNLIFTTVPGGIPELSLGTFRIVSYLLQETLYLASNSKKMNFSELSSYFQSTYAYNDVVVNISALADSDSQQIITFQLLKLIYFNIFCCIFALTLYCFYYSPFLTSEIKLVKNITKILSIIPNAIDSTSLKQSNSRPSINPQSQKLSLTHLKSIKT